MYTVDDNSKYEDEYVEYNSVNNRTGLIIKIIIIIVCILVLILLIKSLKSNKSSDNGQVHEENVLLVRLSAEEYFFIKDNKDKVRLVNLQTLKNNGFKHDIIDANGKTCSDSNTNVTLDKENNNYKMTINLSCSTNDKQEVFYYQNNTLACLNCNGKTIMNGKNTIVADKKEETSVEDNNGGNNNANNNISDDNNTTSGEYSCISWTDWSKDRVFDSSLVERTKTMVLGVKRGNITERKEYGEWSSYTTNPITPSDTLEVETKVESSTHWSSPKTSNKVNKDSKNIKIIATNAAENNVEGCPSGYIEYNNKCYNDTEKVGNLTYKEFNSGDYKVNNGLCEGVKTIKYNDGKYYLTYINCRYHEIAKNVGTINTTGTGEVTYTYQELITTNTTYYRSRTVKTVTEGEDDVYTTEKYEESDLPDGYVKVDGSEEIYYSYKLAVCEK